MALSGSNPDTHSAMCPLTERERGYGDDQFEKKLEIQEKHGRHKKYIHG